MIHGMARVASPQNTISVRRSDGTGVVCAPGFVRATRHEKEKHKPVLLLEGCRGGPQPAKGLLFFVRCFVYQEQQM